MLLHTPFETTFAGLHATPPATLPFAPSLDIRAFLLERERGNVLVYGSPAVDARELERRGGVARRYLGHGHEALLDAGEVRAPLFVHRDDRDAVAERLHVRGSFSRRHVLDEDLEVIPAPGHTPGSTAFLWDNGDHRFLFTGDTVYLRDGEWVGAVLASSDRAAYVNSLVMLRELDFDVLVPWAATAGGPYYAHTDAADARRRLGALLDRVWSGLND